MDLELLVDSADVAADGVDADVETVGHLFVRHPVHETPQHLPLALAQLEPVVRRRRVGGFILSKVA
jgi:hypothetical protein